MTFIGIPLLLDIEYVYYDNQSFFFFTVQNRNTAKESKSKEQKI